MMDRPSLRSAFLGVLLLLIPSLAAAQSPENWQQRVAYDMDITLHADDHEVTGTQTVTYANNSPDTLETLYYHLYFEAFEPTSMMAERNRQLPDPDGRIVPRIFQLGPDEQGWYEVRSLAQDGEAVNFEINDTVLRVDLAEPIPPGTSTTFAMNWRSQVPLQTRRSGRDSRGGGVDFTMTQWYPKIAEYDERGWHADPYVNREFYAPFGTFDVRITLPAQYTVGATGLLQNPDEVGHGYDLAGSGTWRPEDGIPEADSLTWHFVAENVHDFAWAADPDYVHDKVEADGTTHHILYKPDVAASWKDLQKRMPPLTRFFESKFGDYPYPQMTVAQGGDGGMEYPMFTAVAGYDNPEFEEKDGPISILGTTVHEFAHMWYHSALGTNESDYAWMDEGFTTYATEEGMAHLLGREPNHTRSRQSFVYMQKMGLAEPFSTPADWFQTNTAYGITSYPGGQMFVDMMGYVIGDEQQSEWLHRYTRQRLYQHPDPFDIELFAEQVSGLKLDWYFWQFTHSTRQLDDAITDLDQRQTADGVEVDLTLERKGEVRMPQDVKLTLEDGSTQWVNIPLLIMHGHKPVGNDWIVTDPWPWVTPKKTFSFTVPSPVTKAEIDPQGDTPDVNRLNNTADFPVTTRFLRAPESDWFSYQLGIRPLGLYADTFGFGGGVQARGQYLFGDHRLRASLTLWPQVLASNGDDPDLTPSSGFPNTGPGALPDRADAGSWVGGIDYELRYTMPADRLTPRSTVSVSAEKKQGLLENRLALNLPLNGVLDDGTHRLTLSGVHQFNPSDRVFGAGRTLYRVRQDVFFAEAANYNPFQQSHLASATVNWTAESNGNRLSLFGELGGSLKADGRLPGANRIRVEGTQTRDLGPLTARADIQVGLGSDDLALHKRFVLGGRSVESQWRSDVFRQTSAAFSSPVEDVHLVGFGPAGPVAYLRPFDGRSAGLIGPNVVSGRLSLHARPFSAVNALSPLGVEAFSGLGSTWEDGAFFAGFRTEDLVGDAGLGASYDFTQIPHLGRWIAQSDVLQNLKVTAKFPLYASDPALLGDEDEFGFRWLIGVEL